MNLTDSEKILLDGQEGPARQRAMKLLVEYGEALGATRLVDTNNNMHRPCGGAALQARIRIKDEQY